MSWWITFLALTCVHAQTPVKLALNWKAEPQFGGFYEARTKALDLQEGVQMTLVEGGSGTPTVQMLANAQTDFAVVSAEEILISNERNPKNPVVAVFAAYKTNPQMIMCHAEKGFKNLREVFAAKVTLSWQNGLSYAQYLRKLYPTIKAKLVPYSGGIAAFLADRDFCQQGFINSEPIAAQRVGQKVTSFLIAKEGFNPYTTVLAVREETLKSKRDLVQHVVLALRAGWKSYLADASATNAFMHDLNKSMDMETFAKAAALQKDLVDSDGRMELSRWQKLAQTMKDLDLIKSVNVESAFHNF